MDRQEKNIYRTSILFGLAVIIPSVLLRHNDIAAGFCFGAIISIINFGLLKLNIKNLVSAKTGFRYIMFFIGYLSRYILMALALWIAINKSWEAFWSLAAGLFIVRVAIFLTNLKPCRKQVK